MWKVLLSIYVFFFALFNLQAQESKIIVQDTLSEDLILTPQQIAEAHFVAFNERNIDNFLTLYSDDIKIYDFPEILRYEGKEELKRIYGWMFQSRPDMKSELVNRIIKEDTIVSYEAISFFKREKPTKAITIYKIDKGKISSVYIIE